MERFMETLMKEGTGNIFRMRAGVKDLVVATPMHFDVVDASRFEFKTAIIRTADCRDAIKIDRRLFLSDRTELAFFASAPIEDMIVRRFF